MACFKASRILVSILLLVNCDIILGANIVFFFGVATYSHRITVWPLVEGLVQNGHNVTFISAFPAKKPNPKVTELTPKALQEWVSSWEEGPLAFSDRKKGLVPSNWLLLPEYGQTVCELFLNDPEVLDWIEKTPVDLVIIDSLFNDCGYAIAAKNNAKHMIFCTSSLFPWHYDPLGIPVESSWIPDMIYYFQQNMTFLEKVFTAGNTIYWNYIREFKVAPQLEALIKTKLGLDVNLREMERETSLVLVNTYFAEEYARSLPPSIVPIGGMHVQDKTKPLPKDMETFVSKPGAKGFIYISFGSYVEISYSPPEIQNAFFNTLKKLKDVQFIWKWNGEPPISLPNVLFVKWAPQQDILAHSKLIAFMTHSGLLGIQEAITFGVPMICMPVFAEQDYNAERIHRMEHGIRLEIIDITEEKLESAITKIMTDPKYTKNMKLLSKRFKDRPMKPVDTALWWTEFVLRHESTSFLSPLSRYQTWYQRRVLDVWLFLALLSLLIVSTVFFVLIQLAKCFGFSQASDRVNRSNGSSKIKRN